MSAGPVVLCPRLLLCLHSTHGPTLLLSYTDSTTTDVTTHVCVTLERLLARSAELFRLLYRCQPVRERGGEVVTATRAVTLDERCRAEVLQARARTH